MCCTVLLEVPIPTIYHLCVVVNYYPYVSNDETISQCRSQVHHILITFKYPKYNYCKYYNLSVYNISDLKIYYYNYTIIIILYSHKTDISIILFSSKRLNITFYLFEIQSWLQYYNSNY